MRIIVPIFLILALTGGVIFGLFQFKKKKPSKKPIPRIEQVETLTIQPENHTVVLHSQGTIQAATRGMLSLEVSGKITSLVPQFQNGGEFAKGDLLLTIDSTAYEAAVAQAHAQIAQAELKLQEEEARSEQALKEWKAAQNLTSEKPSDLVLRKPQLALANVSLDAARANLKLAESNLQKTQLIAPYSGIIEEKLVEIGQVVSPGTPIARAYSQEILEVKLPLSSEEIDFLKENKPSRVTLHSGAKSWKAEVSRHSGTVDPRTRFHHVIAKIMNTDGQLLPGQFVTAEIEGKSLQNIYRIPRRALLRDDVVYLVTNEDKLLKREINILYRQKDTLIVDKGLEPGVTLSLTRLKVMNDKMKVKRVGASEAPAAVEPEESK